ncbi:unnamed protein product [Paramecium sonneborni]|uniref:Uncharacterized protein n=1 Tax=Paramecium sonneborni TaxID=65129 RepID=A0A8S1LR90_9CILI|nr:unnamed protein product [Paramecium sonneborni]
MYFSNKSSSFSNAETNTEINILFDSMIHVDQMSKMNNTKMRLYCQLQEHGGKLPNFNKLIFDPSSLGRYKNFIGASSKIANYIKLLDPTIRQKFIVDDKYNDYIKQSVHTKKECDKIKALINEHNSIYTLNLKGLVGNDYTNKVYKKKIPHKLSSISTERNSESKINQEIKDVDLTRIHATQRGRKVKVKPLKSNQESELYFNDSPRSVPLQPIKRSQLYQLFVN